MKTYRIQLNLPSGFISPWHADTIFGHLCWVAERHGCFRNFTGAAGLLDLFRVGKPPMILSDGFPGDYLPAPANLKQLFEGKLSGDLTAESYSQIKKVKGTCYLTREQFDAYRYGKAFTVAETPLTPLKTAVTLHNQVNRFTNTTSGESGGLYEQEEVYLGADCDDKLTIYCRLAGGFEDDALLLFERFAVGGYGKKRTSGKGAFSIASFAPFDGFGDIGKEVTTGFVILSHFVPARTDPTDGVYSLMVKYGKLGDEKTFCGNPFKKPLIMVKPGAVFRTGCVKDWYGRLVEDVAYADTAVAQYGYGFAVSVANK